MIFVDSNVPMYLVGSDHPHKHDARMLLERLATAHERLVTSAEVFQEILHRYVAIGHPAAIQPAFDALLGLVDEVFPIYQTEVFGAKDLVATHPRLSARDALHVAVMKRHGISSVLTFDSGFDVVAGVKRIA